MQDLPSYEFGAAPNVTLGRRELVKSTERDIENFLPPFFSSRLKSANVGYDFGPASGQSTGALKDLCPNISTLHAVDLQTAVSSDTIREELKSILITHDKTRIAEFLKNVTRGKYEKADVIMIASVPTLRFGAEDYKNLAESTNEDGVVISLGDTHPNLNPKIMEVFFDFYESENEFRNYWIKK